VTRRGRAGGLLSPALLTIALAWPGAAVAHWAAPEEVVAQVAAPSARKALGVEAATQDQHNARVLVIRVGPGWYALPREKRAKQSREWLDIWQRSVEHGIVAILDAKTDKPAVRFVRGDVAEVLDAPAK
jgi:hypothetical protein